MCGTIFEQKLRYSVNGNGIGTTARRSTTIQYNISSHTHLTSNETLKKKARKVSRQACVAFKILRQCLFTKLLRAPKLAGCVANGTTPT